MNIIKTHIQLPSYVSPCCGGMLNSPYVILPMVCTTCYSTHEMLPFTVQFRPGLPIFEQVVYAAKKAIVAGHLRPGDLFPSVRLLSKELKVNPNTAHKVVSHLAEIGMLVAAPGVGMIVAESREHNAAERTELLGNDIESVVVEAKRLGISLEDALTSFSMHWKQLSPDQLSSEPKPQGRSRKS